LGDIRSPDCFGRASKIKEGGAKGKLKIRGGLVYVSSINKLGELCDNRGEAEIKLG